MVAGILGVSSAELTFRSFHFARPDISIVLRNVVATDVSRHRSGARLLTQQDPGAGDGGRLDKGWIAIRDLKSLQPWAWTTQQK
jgi:hypothetical protein